MEYIETLFALSFLLLGVAIGEDVVDTNGDTVTIFGKYYLLPYNFAVGGGLSLADTANKTCPVDVIKEISEVEKGMPLKLIPAFSKIGFIPTRTRLRVSFADTPECAQTSEHPDKWIVMKDGEKWFVGIGGPENHPGRETKEAAFWIEKFRKGYKFMFCTDSEDVCGNIGIDVDENYNQRLSLSLDDEGAYEFVFQKVDESKWTSPILEVTDKCCL